MPYLKRGDASIYYEEHGNRSGFPILCLAPGSLQSTIDWWTKPSTPVNPFELLGENYRLIALDQRNAGKSWAPIKAEDGWHSYAGDHIALLDDLGVEKCHVIGQCIGVPLGMGLIKAQPGRVVASVCLQPSGRIGPPKDRKDGFDRWRDQLEGHPEATGEVLDSFKRNLYKDDFVYTVSREWAKTCPVPIIVFPGNDDAHPYPLAVELAELVPDSEFVPEWREGEHLEAAKKRILEFLAEHTPAASSAR